MLYPTGVSLLNQPKTDNIRPRSHRNVLLSVEDISHRRSLPELIGLETPQRLAVYRISRGKRAALIAENHDAARGRKSASPGIARARLRQFPRDLARLNIDSAQNLL